MREVARTLEDVGVEPTMAVATAVRQEWVVDAMLARGLDYTALGVPFSWRISGQLAYGDRLSFL